MNNGNGNGYHKSNGNRAAVSTNAVELAMLYNDAAERSVLGSLLIDNDAYGYVRPILNASDFYLVRHQWIYEEILNLIEGSEQADLITLSDRMNRRGQSPDSGWEVYLIGLLNEVPTSVNARYYASIVAEYATRRRMIVAAAQVSQMAANLEMPIDEALGQSENIALGMRGARADQGVKTSAEVGRYYLDRMETLRDDRREIVGLPSGFVDLDRLLGGFEAQYYLMAGRPGMGKSSWVLAALAHAAIRLNKTAMLFSLEMNEKQIMDRLVASEGRIPLEKIKNPRTLSDNEWGTVYEVAGRIGSSRLFFDATPGATPSQILAKALRKSIETGGLDLVVIDHIHIMQADNPGLMETAALTSISKQVMTLPKLLGCPVIVLAQLNRSLEQRANKRPMLSDLRQSGSLEEDAYAVLFLYRDDYYEKEMSERPNVAELEVAKNRDGKTGTVNLFWDGPLTAFRNLSHQKTNNGR